MVGMKRDKHQIFKIQKVVILLVHLIVHMGISVHKEVAAVVDIQEEIVIKEAEAALEEVIAVEMALINPDTTINMTLQMKTRITNHVHITIIGQTSLTIRIKISINIAKARIKVNKIKVSTRRKNVTRCSNPQVGSYGKMARIMMGKIIQEVDLIIITIIEEAVAAVSIIVVATIMDSLQLNYYVVERKQKKSLC